MRSILLVALALIVLCAPVAPAAAETSTQTKLSALASFSVRSKKRCVVTQVSVTAWDVREGDGSGDRVSNPPSDETDPPAIYIAVSKENQCTGDLLVSGSTEVFYTDDEFSESSSLRRANIDASFTIVNSVDGASVPVDLQVRFQGTGSLSRDFSGVASGALAPGETQGVLGQSRGATATGSIVIGSERSTLPTTRDASLLLYQYQIGI